MNRPTVVALFVASIVLFPAAVKAQAADSSNVKSASRKSDLKDSVKDTQDEFKQLVDFMMRNGLDNRYGEHIAPVLGLPGARPVKGNNIRAKKVYKDRGGLNCAVVYEESPEATEYNGKRPICLFLQNMKVSGLDTEDRFYRLSLDGHLEKVVLSRGKIDENGKGVRGSGIDSNEDINSPEVKKALAAEMADVRQWLKQQKTVVAKTATASAAKPEEAVRVSAVAASAAVDKEAAAASDESAPAPASASATQ